MNSSRMRGRLWSFGITIMNGKKDWIGQMVKCVQYDSYKNLHKLWENKNANCVDYFFSYLKKLGKFNLQSFYVENMKFIHFSDNFLLAPFDSGIYLWQEGRFISLGLYHIFSAMRVGNLPIDPSVIKLYTVNKDESDDFLQTYIPIVKTMENAANPWLSQNLADNLDAVLQ